MIPFSKFLEFVVERCFPKHCLVCDLSGTFLCDSCFRAVPLHANQLCPICMRHNTPQGDVCFDCFGSSALDGIFVAAPYRNSPLAAIIHAYKYRSLRVLADPLGTFLSEAVSRADIPLPTLLCAVPLHSMRLRFRGFNQSELLAEALAAQLAPSFPLAVSYNELRRIRFTAPQMSIARPDERHDNIRDAFAWRSRETSLENASVWLVDDVATTTATLAECARVLKQAGAREVRGIVLAR
jgi:ComF family protein